MTEPSATDPATICERIERPKESVRDAARMRHEQLAKTTGSLGVLEELSIWLAGVQNRCPPLPLTRVRVVVFAGDHGIASSGVSAQPRQVTAELVTTTLAGGAAVNALAMVSGAELRIVDVAVDCDHHTEQGWSEEVTRFKIRRGSGRIDREDAVTLDEAEQAFRAGAAVADDEIDRGADLLVVGHLGVAGTTPAAAIIGTLLRLDASVVTGRGSGIDDHAWMRKSAAVRDAMRRGRLVLADPLELLAAIGGADFAALTGFLLEASARCTPVVLDGVVSAACAMVAHRSCFRAADWWLAGHCSPEPAHKLALTRMALAPLLTPGLRVNDGSGALLAVPFVQAAARTLGEMTLDESPQVASVPRVEG